MSEKENKVNEQPQVTLQEKKELLPGITVIPITNFIPLKDLTKDDIRKMGLVRVEINAVFRKNSNDRINFKVYPFKNVFKNNVFKNNIFNDEDNKFAEYSDLIRINDEISNNERLTRNEYISILINSKMKVEVSDNSFSLLRHARLLTGVSKKTGERYYKMQLFISKDIVKTFWISDHLVQTLSDGIVGRLFQPVTFYEATSEELELDNEKELQEEYI